LRVRRMRSRTASTKAPFSAAKAISCSDAACRAVSSLCAAHATRASGARLPLGSRIQAVRDAPAAREGALRLVTQQRRNEHACGQAEESTRAVRRDERK
jgi:hypothetical protein